MRLEIQLNPGACALILKKGQAKKILITIYCYLSLIGPPKNRHQPPFPPSCIHPQNQHMIYSIPLDIT